MGSFRAFKRNMKKNSSVEDPILKQAIMFYIHFGEQKTDSISCETCADFKQGVCAGRGLKAAGCLGCMVSHSEKTIMKTDGKAVFCECAG
jgi:hypothetical protein